MLTSTKIKCLRNCYLGWGRVCLHGTWQADKAHPACTPAWPGTSQHQCRRPVAVVSTTPNPRFLTSPAEKQGWGSTSSLRQLYSFRWSLAGLQLAWSMGRASSCLLAKHCAHLPSHRPDSRPGGWGDEENSHRAAIMDSWLLQNRDSHFRADPGLPP